MDDQQPAADGLDLAALQAELRRTAGGPVPCASSLTRHAIAASLEQIKQHIEVGQGTPELGRFRGALRLAARLLARAVLYCLRFFTNRLRLLHHALLNTLHHLHVGLIELESKQQREIQELRAEIEELRQALPRQPRRAA